VAVDELFCGRHSLLLRDDREQAGLQPQAKKPQLGRGAL
jgi:hypothetical protein